MTREEAIAVLESDAEYMYSQDSPYNREAYRMAVEALEAEPTLSEIAQYCEKRRLVLVESAVFEKMKSRCSTESIKHGHWIDVRFAPLGNKYATCSECGVRQTLDKDNFCPNCGAKMDEVEE